VPGLLEASGSVEVHDHGFRAERGRPYQLVLLPNRNARQLERLAQAYDVELVQLQGPRDVLDHCREQGLGLSESVVAELVGAETLAANRRARRRRALLTVAILAAFLLTLGGIAIAVDPGAEHGKVVNGRSGEMRVP
jgi:hypothetical protein